MNRLPRVLITLATALAFALCARAQTPQPRAAPESEARDEARSAPDAAEGSGAEKARVRFEGLNFFEEAGLRGELRMRETGVFGTFDYDPARVENALRVLKKMYASRGFADATVEVREEPWSKPRLFTFVVSEGGRARLNEIRFEGAGPAHAARLAEEAKRCLSDEDDGESWREDFNLDRVDYCARDRAKRVLTSEGYVRATMGEPVVEKLRRGLRVNVRVEEGMRYRYGDVRVKGATVFLAGQILEMMDARRGEFVDAWKIIRGLGEDLSGEYLDRGYAQFSYEVTPTFRDARGRKGEGVADFRIDITEGPRFAVSSVIFTGNRLKTEGELKAAFSLSAGDVFSRRRFLDGLERLNQMGAHVEYPEGNFPSGWREVDCELDEGRGLVAIRIIVKESNP